MARSPPAAPQPTSFCHRKAWSETGIVGGPRPKEGLSLSLPRVSALVTTGAVCRGNHQTAVARLSSSRVLSESVGCSEEPQVWESVIRSWPLSQTTGHQPEIPSHTEIELLDSSSMGKIRPQSPSTESLPPCRVGQQPKGAHGRRGRNGCCLDRGCPGARGK